LVPLARLIGFFRSARQIVSVWPHARAELGPKIALFMHFDGHGKVRTQVLDYMKELAANGRSVVFVTNSKKLTPPALQAVQAVCAAVIIRRNVGYDFGAWRDALFELGLPRPNTEEVILANDSVFGPLLPLGDVLRRLDYTKADVWGLTESWQERYHLQSFFLAFGKAALEAEAFGKFWRRVRPVPLKTYIVQTYEIGVTQAMLKGGLRCDALWRYETLIKLVDRAELDRLIQQDGESTEKDPINQTRKSQVLRIRDAVAHRRALNPTSDLWRQLLLTGFPFIKRELLRLNPTHVEDVGDWVDVVRETLAVDPEPVVLDLRSMMKGSAP